MYGELKTEHAAVTLGDLQRKRHAAEAKIRAALLELQHETGCMPRGVDLHLMHAIGTERTFVVVVNIELPRVSEG
jgi:hypothetical protein